MNAPWRPAWATALLFAVHAAAMADAAEDLQKFAGDTKATIAQRRGAAPSLEAVTEQCTAAERAEVALLVPTPDVDLKRQRSERALRERQACDALKARLAGAALANGRLAHLDAEITARLGRCLAAGDGPDAAAECGASLKALKSLWEPAAPAKGEASPEATVLEVAGAAQDKVDKLRVKFKTAYDRGDAAAAAAMALPAVDTLGTGLSRERVRENVRRWTDDSTTKAREFRTAIRLAQAEADRLVAAVLARRKCGTDADCLDLRQVQALAARASFEVHLAQADSADEALSEAAMGLAVVKDRPDIDSTELGNAVAFRKLLQDNPDVKSFFGGPAVGLSIGADDSSVSFRVVKENNGGIIGRSNRWTLVFTAPTKDGRSTFANSADAFRNLTSVKLSWQLTNQPFKLPGLGTLNDFALGVGVGQDQRSYFPTDDAKAAAPVEVEKNFKTYKAGVRWAFLANPKSDYKTLLVLGYDQQRLYRNGDVETRCPGASPSQASSGLHALAAPLATTLVSCYTGAWGAPTRLNSQLLGLELRQHTPFVDFGLKVKQDRKTDKVDVDLPVYVIRSLPGDSADTTFNAGFSLSRTTGDTGLKWGLFVSAPLSFGSPPRP